MEYFALIETGKIVRLGVFDDFEAASEYADRNHWAIWVFSKEALESMLESAQALSLG